VELRKAKEPKKDKQKQDRLTQKKKQEKREESEKIKNKASVLREFARKFHFKKVLILLIAILVTISIIVPIGIYFYGPLGKITRPIFKKIPYPVAFVGEERELISTRELIQNVDAVRKFYEDQDLASKGLRVDFNTKDGKMRLKVKEREILDKQVEDRIIEQLANKHGINITIEDAQEELDRAVAIAGSKKAVELRLASLYGWKFDDLRDKVIVYQMYTKRLLEKYAEISKEQSEYLEMEKAKTELTEDGSNFSDIVEKYSEGESKKSSGELGWFPLDKISTEVAMEIGEYQKGQISGIIPSRLGFHIVQLQDYREIEEIAKNDDEFDDFKKGDIIKRREVKIRQIFKRGISFVKWIEEEKQKTKVSVWMKDYQWDKASGHIRFADEEARLMEKRIKNRSKGDPSIK